MEKHATDFIGRNCFTGYDEIGLVKNAGL